MVARLRPPRRRGRKAPATVSSAEDYSDGESDVVPPPPSSSRGVRRPAPQKFADTDDYSDDEYDRPAPARRPAPSSKSSKRSLSSSKAYSRYDNDHGSKKRPRGSSRGLWGRRGRD